MRDFTSGEILFLHSSHLQDLIETLQSANELESDWEVVFPDCPVKAIEKSKGTYSISG